MFTIKAFMGAPDSPFNMICLHAKSFNISEQADDVALIYQDRDGKEHPFMIGGSGTRRLIVENETGKTIVNMPVARGSANVTRPGVLYENLCIEMPDGSLFVKDVAIANLPQDEESCCGEVNVMA